MDARMGFITVSPVAVLQVHRTLLQNAQKSYMRQYLPKSSFIKPGPVPRFVV